MEYFHRRGDSTRQRSAEQVSALGGDCKGAYFYSRHAPYGYVAIARTLLSFKGDRLDSIAGFYLSGNGHRGYAPLTGRFTSPDRLSPFAAGGLNPYVYCLADPVNRHDPSGRFSLFSWPARLYRRLHSKRSNLPDTLYAAGISEAKTTFVSYRNVPSKYKLNIVEHAESVPPGYELIGFHGSQARHTQSLEAGVDPSRLKRDLLGKGFYGSTSYRYASRYAGDDGRVFGIYGRNTERWRANVQFDSLGSNIILIRPASFSNIIVRAEIKMPLRLLHPLQAS